MKALHRPLHWPKYDVPENEPEVTLLQSSSSNKNVTAPAILNNLLDDWDMSCYSNEEPVHVSAIEEDLPALNQLIISNVAETIFDTAECTIEHMSSFVNKCCSIVSCSFSGFKVELQQQVATFALPLLAKLDTL